MSLFRGVSLAAHHFCESRSRCAFCPYVSLLALRLRMPDEQFELVLKNCLLWVLAQNRTSARAWPDVHIPQNDVEIVLPSSMCPLSDGYSNLPEWWSLVFPRLFHAGQTWLKFICARIIATGITLIFSERSLVRR